MALASSKLTVRGKVRNAIESLNPAGWFTSKDLASRCPKVPSRDVGYTLKDLARLGELLMGGVASGGYRQYRRPQTVERTLFPSWCYMEVHALPKVVKSVRNLKDEEVPED